MYRIVVRQWMPLGQCIEHNTEWRSHVHTSWYSDIEWTVGSTPVESYQLG